MAAAFLPWEKWLARLLHPIAVAIKRGLYQVRRSRCLERSQDWPRAEGTVIVNKLGQSVSSGRNLVLLFDGTGLSIRLFLALV